MTVVDRTIVSLRVLGDDLDPEEVGRVLGAAPTASCRKGEARSTPSGSSVPARTGMWRLQVASRSPGDLDAQIEDVLSRLTPDAAVWRDLSRRFRCGIFCGVFMRDANEGLDLAPETMTVLAARSLRLELDLYGPADG